MYRILIISFLFVTLTYSQKYNFIKYNVKQGLSLSQVSDLDVCSDGRLLISTFGGGLDFYDGQTFSNITTIDGLVNSTIFSTIIQNENIFWVGTEKGLSRIDKSGIKNYNKSNGLSSNTIWTLEVGTDNVLWIGTENGLVKYKDRKFEIVENELVANKTIWALFRDSNGDLFISTKDDLIFYDYEKKEFIKPEKYSQLKKINSISEAKDGTLFFGTENGLFEQVGDNFLHYTEKDGLTNNFIWDTFIDSENNLWLGTNKGVTLFSDGKFTKFDKSNGLSDYRVNKINEDLENNIWFGARKGLFKLTNTSFKIYTEVNNKPIDAWTIVENDEDEYLIGSELEGIVKFKNGQFSLIDEENFRITGLSTLFIDRDKNLWVASKNGIYRYPKNNYKTYNKKYTEVKFNVTHILQEDNGHLKFGTLYNGIIEFDGKNFKTLKISNTEKETVFYHFVDKQNQLWVATNYGLQTLVEDSVIIPKGFEKLQDYSFLNILEDGYGYIWAGSYEGGLICFDSKDIENPKFDTISVEHGLSNEAIMATALDADGNLWVSTNAGINRINISEYHELGKKNILAYGEDDGFIGFEGYQNGILSDSKGNMLISTLGGIIVFNPKKIKANKKAPVVKITRLKTIDADFNEKVMDHSSIASFSDSYVEFAYDLNSFIIEFVGISLTNPSKVKYSYRIDGGEWTVPSKKPSISFSNIDYGKHIFEVIAYNNDGVSSKNIAAINFKVVAPFWLKLWFQVLAVLVALGIIFLFYLFRLNRMGKINKELEDRIEERVRYEAKLKKSEQELRKAKEAAEQSDKLKTEFLAQMSHEIRTPINTILSYTNLLREDVREKIDESLKDCFSTIDNSSHRLIRTIDSILNMSQLQTGNFELTMKQMNLCTILKNLYLELENLANQKNIKLKFEVKEDECYVVVDEYTITQLFTNLIDNAIKYTNKGEIRIIVHKKLDDKVIVEIRDTGIGISEEYQKNIFEPFIQEEQGYTRKYEGTGLGLALVKKYAELNNAKLTLKSKKGKGTTFFVEFNN